jgi:hypothetical protein
MKLAKRRRLRHAAALTVGLTLACLVVSGPALAEGGNSANAKLCQKGGWQDLQSSSGGSFANQDECVSYGAGAGVGRSFIRRSRSIRPHVPEGADSFITVTGFHPLSTAT